MNRKLILTTSREPSRRTRSFVKDLTATIPHALKINRGKATLQDLRNTAINKNAYGVLVVYERKANPSALVYYELSDSELSRVYLLKITSVKLSREIREYHRPLGIKMLVINASNIIGEFPVLVTEALIRIFKPLIYQNERPLRAIEIVIIGSESEVTISFMCSSSNRPCGPSFKVIGVKKYV